MPEAAGKGRLADHVASHAHRCGIEPRLQRDAASFGLVAHRHEVEQTLITRASLLEQQSAKRSAALQEREQRISEQLAAARALFA